METKNEKITEKLKDLAGAIIETMSEEEKEKAHKELTKKVVGDFVDNIHRTNCMFGFGGSVEAAIVTGKVTYTVKVDAENTSPEHYAQWEANGTATN